MPSVSMARLLPLAVRVDPDRSSEYLWRAIAARPPRAAGAVHGSATPETRQHIPGPRPARGAGRPLRPRGGRDDLRPGRRERPGPARRPLPTSATRPAAILQAAAAFDPRAALAMVDALPDDPEPKPAPGRARPPAFAPRVKEKARLAVARALALPPGARRREALRIPGQLDLWPAVLDD